MNEEEYKKSLAASGVELPELKAEEKKEEKKEESDESQESNPEKEDSDDSDEELPTPKEQKKRSIYDEYKEKKAELKSEKELREIAERERDELKSKLEAFKNADTAAEKKTAGDELEEFAKKTNTDPVALREMRELFLKGVTPKTDESLQKDLEEFKSWKAKNQMAIDKVAFDNEFNKTLPAIKQIFPNASPEEMSDIKTELDKLAHSKEWHDKDLEYVAFKHKEHLNTLVSPKKRGMESKARKDSDEVKTDFNPNADYSKMSMAEREAWEKSYREMTKVDGIVQDSQGRKILI